MEYKDFEEKIKEVLELQFHIQPDNWKGICYALFLHYQSRIEYEKKT